mmetsp:Transcript_30365/g.35826  ORF Transcript_30365/g.35826 Transcript_30365/m.35826 type:complete len:228 (+) Transcript_30365:23-706(+)
MAKAGAKEDYNDVKEDGGAERKGSLQSAFANWKRRQAGKAQPKNSDKNGKGEKGSDNKSVASAAGAKEVGNSAAQSKPPAPYIADAYRPNAVRNLLDLVVDWYTNNKELSSELNQWFYDHASKIPPIDMKRVDEGEYPVEAYSVFQEYTAMIEEKVEGFLKERGGSLEELHQLAKDETEVAYSDAWMFVTLFSACTTFLFFADMTKQAQEGDLKFDTTTGLNPKYSI